MAQQKVTVDEETVRAIDLMVSALGYRSRSAFIRTAVEEKLRAERRRLREALRRKAYESYAAEPAVAVWGELEGEGFEER